MIRVFHLDDGVRAVGHRRSRHDANRRPRLERAFARIPGCHVPADGQRGRNAGDVGVADGEAVHRGVCERGHAQTGDHFPRQHEPRRARSDRRSRTARPDGAGPGVSERRHTLAAGPVGQGVDGAFERFQRLNEPLEECAML